MHVKFTRVIEMSWSREVIFKCPYEKSFQLYTAEEV